MDDAYRRQQAPDAIPRTITNPLPVNETAEWIAYCRRRRLYIEGGAGSSIKYSNESRTTTEGRWQMAEPPLSLTLWPGHIEPITLVDRRDYHSPPARRGSVRHTTRSMGHQLALMKLSYQSLGRPQTTTTAIRAQRVGLLGLSRARG